MWAEQRCEVRLDCVLAEERLRKKSFTNWRIGLFCMLLRPKLRIRATWDGASNSLINS